MFYLKREVCRVYVYVLTNENTHVCYQPLKTNVVYD